ncbi:Mvp17/PMP22 family protein [Histoplasma capsulatum var. duboisii H88]|uniref:Mvp17/PMP22 family protein n=1 Tax=Ajellomyces capsulatus (strain H88) TaxID=544711 RepID=F0UB28_AJEC8|nr:Mvp17/PMP22 family protein [Histoplasma capsulatum var. duboisii H88]QSS49179.1 Mvp17/PMP22 family protein [Histoplasma capsulatum var. duboisii H88]
MIDKVRRNVLDGLNSRYIYGRWPLLHTLVFLIEMAVTMRLAAKFNSYYAEKPVLTTMVTNAVLGGIADTVAQSITAVRTRMATHRRSRSNANDPNNDLISIEIHSLNKEKPPAVGELGSYNTRHLATPFDFERLTRFMAYGFFMAPIQFQWFGFLARSFPITTTHATVPALKRVAMDQLIFAPIGLLCFFTFMTVAEGGGRRAIVRKMQDVYTPTLKANFMLWPAVQILNFRVIPIQFQIPFVSTVGIAWTAYLSLANSAEEE